MFVKSAVLIAILSFSSLLWSQQEGSANNAPAATACSFTYSSGPVATFTQYCLSTNGNIVEFASPLGEEYIAGVHIHEGYGFCDFNGSGGPVAYFDYADTDSGNWGATTVTAPNVTTRKFVRTTSDGNWQLTQTMKQIKATATTMGSVQITMALKNLTSTSRPSVYFVRVANVDVTGASDHFDNTMTSATGEQVRQAGLNLAANTFSFSHIGYTQNVFSGPDPCDPFKNVNTGAFTGDGSIGHWFNFPVSAGGTQTVILTYKPI